MHTEQLERPLEAEPHAKPTHPGEIGEACHCDDPECVPRQDSFDCISPDDPRFTKLNDLFRALQEEPLCLPRIDQIGSMMRMRGGGAKPIWIERWKSTTVSCHIVYNII